jgi:hypothetical protein
MDKETAAYMNPRSTTIRLMIEMLSMAMDSAVGMFIEYLYAFISTPNYSIATQ